MLSVFDVQQWIRSRHEENRDAGGHYRNGRDDVTVVAYCFASQEKMHECVASIEFALRETYRNCGLLKTTIVVNRMTERLEYLKSEFGCGFRVDVDDTLVPGDIVGFSRNMIKTLPDRFDTTYILNVHPDGFPLRRGLDDFVGRWDYIGGPWNITNDDLLTKALLSRNDGSGNGGFALRTRKICEIGAAAYKRFWKIIPDCYLLYEDIFFTRFLTRWHPGYAKSVSLAPRSEALKFSVSGELMPGEYLNCPPFGFHSAIGFTELVRRLGDSILSENE